MLGCHELVTGRALLQTFKHVEDTALAIIQQKDTEIAAQVLVPEGILVVKETEVANNTEDFFIRYDREASSCR